MTRVSAALSVGVVLLASPALISPAMAESDSIEGLKNRSAKKRWQDAFKAPRFDFSKLNPFSKKSATTEIAVAPANEVPVRTAQQKAYEGEVQTVQSSTVVPRVASLRRRQGSAEYKIANDPKDLKRISAILPYPDYEPDSKIAKDDPCLNQCPAGICKREGEAQTCPEEIALSTEEYTPRKFEPALYQWKASDLHHNPLYFEDVGLERYGHTYNEWVQPFVSAGKFSTQLIGSPYQMTIDPVWKDMYTLGHYRPGECAPKKIYRIPWSTEAAINQAGVMTGLFFIIP
ncbi:MAG: hypothetical protein CMJ78_20035 [Planctomycetaceae bacterium]|nr:hypothetical protein [Planctomycetaceae bacterium]